MTHNNDTKISLIGDIALSGLFRIQPHKNKERFKEVSKILKKSDLVFTNLEAPLFGNGEINEKKKNSSIIIYSDESIYKDVLPRLNISAVSLANNHIYDCKESGIKNTIKCLQELDIKFTGAGYKKEHTNPVIIKKNGKNIVFIAYVDRNTNPLIDDNANIYINYYNEEKIIKEIIKTKEECDFLILSLHWGIDYSHYPTRYQRVVCRKFIDAGADVIMGHHTHTIQPYEIYNNGIIFYSLGHLCYGDYYKNNKLVSIKRKTKKSYIPVVNLNSKILSLFSFKELINNYIIVDQRNIKFWNKIHILITKAKHKNKLVNLIIDCKEIFIDRVIEYFFGYYRNPFLRLFDVSNLIKIKLLFIDYKWKKHRNT